MHCTHCGTEFNEDALYPKTCGHCANVTYANPIPVAVGLIQVVGGGLLIVKRDIDPKDWALPGGFVEVGETWQQGLSREMKEETRLDIPAEAFKIFQVHSTPDTRRILMFATCAYELGIEDVNDFEPTPEVSALAVVYNKTKLAFPLHTAVAADWFTTPT